MILLTAHSNTNWSYTVRVVFLWINKVGFDFGMIVGTSTVIYAAWLMYEKGWREEDED